MVVPAVFIFSVDVSGAGVLAIVEAALAGHMVASNRASGLQNNTLDALMIFR
jgi:hypothetical protein